MLYYVHNWFLVFYFKCVLVEVCIFLFVFTKEKGSCSLKVAKVNWISSVPCQELVKKLFEFVKT